jgi:hypothetical protein
VDFKAGEVPSIAELRSQADSMSDEWDKMLVGCIDEPRSGGADVVTSTLKGLVARVESGGDLGTLLCFDREGDPILFE